MAIMLEMNTIGVTDIGSDHGRCTVFFSQSINKLGPNLPQCASDQDVVSWRTRHASD